MKKIVQIKKAIPVLGSACAIALAAVEHANAALTWTGITLNTTDVESAMGLIIVGLATLWGFRKIVKTMNRS